MSKLLVALLLVAIVAEMIEAKPNLQSRSDDGVDESDYDTYPDDNNDESGKRNGGSEPAKPRLPVPGSGSDS
uniref:Madanin 4 n=1 Tax=Hyalomma rufipes TaxID=72862 RepID=E2J6R0_HYARU